MNGEHFEMVMVLLSGSLIVAMAGIIGWVYTTRIRIKAGYP